MFGSPIAIPGTVAMMATLRQMIQTSGQAAARRRAPARSLVPVIDVLHVMLGGLREIGRDLLILLFLEMGD